MPYFLLEGVLGGGHKTEVSGQFVPFIRRVNEQRVGVLVGVGDFSLRPHEEERTLELLDSLENLPVDEAIADRAGRLIYQHARQGIQFSFADALIAATALHHDLALATTSPEHFPMPELRLYSPDIE